MNDWLGLLNPMNKEHVNTSGEGGFTDFASLLTRYFTTTFIRGEGDYSIATLSIKQIFYIQWLFRAGITALCAWVVLKFIPKRFDSKQATFAGMAFFLACIPAAFPHQRDYSVFLCLPAVALILHSFLVNKHKPPKWIIGLTLISLALMGCLIFFPLLPKAFRHFIMESRIPGWGMLLFIPTILLWWKSQPKSVAVKEGMN